MANLTLTGTEVLLVTPITANGLPAAVSGQTTTQAIANLAGSVGLTQIELNGSTSGTTIVKPTAIASGTLTFPAVTDTIAVLGTAQTFTAAQTFTNSDLILLGSSTGATTFTSANAGASNYTVTVPAVTGTLKMTTTPPVAVGSTLAVTSASAGATLLLNTASGSVATLPAATGSGATYKFVVSTTVTSNSHKILAATTADFINGAAFGQHSGATLGFSSAAATNHSIQMPAAGSTPSGGFIDDYFEFTDVANNLWQCNGMFQGGTTVTTPFNSADT
jgi:hypothetical protein